MWLPFMKSPECCWKMKCDPGSCFITAATENCTRQVLEDLGKAEYEERKDEVKVNDEVRKKASELSR